MARETGNTRATTRSPASPPAQRLEKGRLKQRGALQVSLDGVAIDKCRSGKDDGPLSVFQIHEKPKKNMQDDLEATPTQGDTSVSNYRNTTDNIQSEHHSHLRVRDGTPVPRTDQEQEMEGGFSVCREGGGARRYGRSGAHFPTRDAKVAEVNHQAKDESVVLTPVDHFVKVWRREQNEDCPFGGKAEERPYAILCEVTRVEVRPERKEEGLEGVHSAHRICERHERDHQGGAAHLQLRLENNKSYPPRAVGALDSQGQHGVPFSEKDQGGGYPYTHPALHQGRAHSGETVPSTLVLHKDRGTHATATQQAPAQRDVVRHKWQVAPEVSGRVRDALLEVGRILSEHKHQKEAFEEDMDVTLQPEGSDSWPHFTLRSIDGKLIIVRDRRLCFHDLAPISDHALDLARVISCLKQSDEDPLLLSLIDRFIIGNEPLIPLTNVPPRVSRNFSRNDLEVLSVARLLSPSEARNAMLCFKVPKKDGFGRFIMDCRPLNELYKEERISMDMEQLDDVIKLALRYPTVISTDANAFFFQFRVTKVGAQRFPARIGHQRGNFSCFNLTALPMGFKFAPAIAQRTSNMVIRRVKQWILENNVNGDTVAWVDNYLVFAENEATADRIMIELLRILKYFNIECKPVERTGEFLGLKADTQGVCLSEKFVEKALKSKNDFFNNPIATLGDFLIVFGHVIWANITIIRRPLCFMPNCLSLLRRAALDSTSTIETEAKKSILNELIFFEEHVRMHREITAHQPCRAWSDATPSGGAILVEDEEHSELLAVCKFVEEVPIFLSELGMAVWAALCTTKHPHSIVDNTAAGFAIAKGHSTHPTANKLLRLLYSRNPPNKASWVSTTQQRADDPSRGKSPPARKDSYDSEKNLKSFFFL